MLRRWPYRQAEGTHFPPQSSRITTKSNYLLTACSSFGSQCSSLSGPASSFFSKWTYLPRKSSNLPIESLRIASGSSYLPIKCSSLPSQCLSFPAECASFPSAGRAIGPHSASFRTLKISNLQMTAASIPQISGQPLTNYQAVQSMAFPLRLY